MNPDLVSETSWFEALPDPERRYPVLVTYTRRHVVWVETDSPATAHGHVTGDPDEYIDQVASYSDGYEVELPDSGDWRYGWSSGIGRPHGPWRPGEPEVYTWRDLDPERVARAEARMAAAAEADPSCVNCGGSGRTYARPGPDGPTWDACATCRPGGDTAAAAANEVTP